MSLAIAQQRIDLKLSALHFRAEHRREFAPIWYDWQNDFLYSKKSQTMLLCGNRTGKTLTAGFLFATHCTGDYPDDWSGQRFGYGLEALAAGVDAEQLKAVVQRQLFGDVDEFKRFTGGWFHREEIVDIEWSGTVTGLARRVKVKVKGGGTSLITLRQYTQSRTGSGTLSFAGTSLDLIWIDECPNDALVGQLVTRTMTGNRGAGGIIIYSMTPELGMTSLVASFMEHKTEHQKLVGPVSWDECPHLTPSIQEQILSGIPIHEHDMRRKGIPFFGAGLIYPVVERRIKIEPFNFDEFSWFRCIRAIDLGVRHPQATAWLAFDPEADTMYLAKDYAMEGQSAAVHAAATNTMWAHTPVVVPHDYDTVEKGTATAVSEHYYTAGLKNTIPFENPGGGIKVEPGIQALYDRMIAGKFKAFSTCTNFFRELRMYHRDIKGMRVSENDDVLDCVRQGSQMIGRYGVSVQPRRRKPRVRRAMG